MIDPRGPAGYVSGVRSAELSLPEVSGPIVIDTNMWSGRHQVEVAGQPAAPLGRNVFDLPASAGGTVQGRVRFHYLRRPFPALEIGGVLHPTGPAVPTWLAIIALLPIVLLVVGGLLGGLLAAGAIVGNVAVLRTRMGVGAKAGAVAGIILAAVVVFVVLATLVLSASFAVGA